MATFARKVGNQWLDVTTGPDAQTVSARYGSLGYYFQSCPDTDTGGNPTKHGAVDNGDGTCTNPTVPVPPAAPPAILTDKQFRKYAAQTLQSAAAVGSIWKAAQASADPDIQFAFMAWSKAQTFEKNEVESLTASLVPSCMTAVQRTAILNNWPTQ